MEEEKKINGSQVENDDVESLDIDYSATLSNLISAYSELLDFNEDDYMTSKDHKEDLVYIKEVIFRGMVHYSKKFDEYLDEQ